MRLSELVSDTGVFIAAGQGFTEQVKLEESKLAQVDDSILVTYPSEIFLTARAADDGT